MQTGFRSQSEVYCSSIVDTAIGRTKVGQCVWWTGENSCQPEFTGSLHPVIDWRFEGKGTCSWIEKAGLNFPSSSCTDAAEERCWRGSESGLSLTIRLILFNCGTSGNKCELTEYRLKNLLLLKRVGLILAPQGPNTWMDLDSARGALDRDLNPVEDLFLPSTLVPLKHPVEFQLEVLNPSGAKHAYQRCVHPVFLASLFRDCSSPGLCAWTLKTDLYKLLLISDTQTFPQKKDK